MSGWENVPVSMCEAIVEGIAADLRVALRHLEDLPTDDFLADDRFYTIMVEVNKAETRIKGALARLPGGGK